jgi:peptide/nickel transport system permease protein
MLRKLLRRPNATFGLAVTVAVVLLTTVGAWLTPYDPIKQDLSSSLHAPSSTHLLGTDTLGRDVLSRIIYGSRVSLFVGLASVVVGVVAGGLLGLASGYLGGWIDLLLQRTVDIVMSFPSMVLALLIGSMLGGGLTALIIAIGSYNVARFARLVRSQVIQLKQEAYIEAERAIGSSALRIIARHLVPNLAMPVLIMATLRLSGAILIEASLSYLGLGVPPPTPTWGGIAADGQNILLFAPWVSLFAGLVIMVAVLGFNLLGDGLRDLFDPRLRRS